MVENFLVSRLFSWIIDFLSLEENNFLYWEADSVLLDQTNWLLPWILEILHFSSGYVKHFIKLISSVNTLLKQPEHGMLFWAWGLKEIKVSCNLIARKSIDVGFLISV